MPTLDSIMADYLERLERGQQPVPDEYLQAHPEYAAELRDFFQNHHWLEATPAGCRSLEGTQIGPYHLQKEIARGGMGIVYRAQQAGLKRPVAVKVIGTGVLASEEERRRFRIEAEAAARMRHPAIVPIHDIGTAEGYAYFSMTLIEGPTLQQLMQQGCCTDQQAATYVREIARAVGYAHRQGIVHRDLKPDNVLTDAEGRPWLTDFGLAKWHRAGTLLTRTGQVLGTPAYMSPEQAAGRADTGPATDIYSLGAILYALLTGRPPHVGANPAEILLQVQQADPTPPHEIRRDVPTDLEKIIMRCLEQEPAHRYPSADALADDLQRWLDGEPVEAASSGWLHTVARSLGRDQHQQHFRNWGRGLFIMGCVIFVTHLTIFALDRTGAPAWLAFWTPRLTMFAILGCVIYYYRDGKWSPRNNAERPVWSIWIGYLITLAVINLLLLSNDIPHHAIFPMAAALSGFGFLALGGHVWGGCILIGLTFEAVALLTAWLPPVAPLIFGTTWLVAMSALAQRYRATQAPVEKPAGGQSAHPSRPGDGSIDSTWTSRTTDETGTSN